MNKIICGEAAPILKTFEAESVNLVVTDAPYLCNYKDRSGRQVKNDTVDSEAAVLSVIPEIYRVLKPDSYFVLFCGWLAIPQFSNAWAQAGFGVGGQIVWPKQYASSARHLECRQESAWVLTKGRPRLRGQVLPDVMEWTYSGNRFHPTEKAVEIIKPLVRSFSKQGDVVLDPFLGSGTTAVAAALTDRQYIGVELEARYCALAERRLAGVHRYREEKLAA